MVSSLFQVLKEFSYISQPTPKERRSSNTQSWNASSEIHTWFFWIMVLCPKKSTLKSELKHSAISSVGAPCSAVHAFTVFPCYCNPQLEIYSGIFCFSSFNMCGLFFCTLSFKPPKEQKSSGVRSGDWRGHTFWEIMLLPKNLCNICMCYRPFLLKLVELFITFQQGN